MNYRLDPEVLARILPSPFRPKLYCGFGMGGVCLIRLKSERPAGIPAVLGFSSENGAHRFAVEWDEGDETREGVFVPRRDTNSCLSTALGGRLFPGKQFHATFTVREEGDEYEVRLESRDGESRLFVSGRVADALPASSVFTSVEEASAFFEKGAVGYSSTDDLTKFDGIELVTRDWKVEPLAVEVVESSMFDDQSMFPDGSAIFDHALLMRDISHEWVGLDRLCCTDANAV